MNASYDADDKRLLLLIFALGTAITLGVVFQATVS